MTPDSIRQSLLWGRLQAAAIGLFVAANSAYSLWERYTALSSDGFTVPEAFTLLREAGPMLDSLPTIIALIGGVWVAGVSVYSKFRGRQ